MNILTFRLRSDLLLTEFLKPIGTHLENQLCHICSCFGAASIENRFLSVAHVAWSFQMALLFLNGDVGRFGTAELSMGPFLL